MRGTRAKKLRKLARLITQGNPEREYVPGRVKHYFYDDLWPQQKLAYQHTLDAMNVALDRKKPIRTTTQTRLSNYTSRAMYLALKHQYKRRSVVVSKAAGVITG